MKQVIQNFRNGEIKIKEVPSPGLRGEGALVVSRCSVISAGTERTVVEEAQKGLVGKAQSRPDLIGRVLKMIKEEGLGKTIKFVRERLDKPGALGYSSAGEVIAVAGNVDELQTGQRVACAGVGYASHAEVVFVPKNLCVRIPDPVSYEDAAFATLGAIALQGVRQAEVTVGETVAVIGLGLIGLITVQILKASGCRVLGADPAESRGQLARDLGIDLATSPDSLKREVFSKTRDRGVDAVIITASTSDSGPVRLAGEISRDRGRVVVVGNVRVEAPRDIYYRKELALRLSRSYGPGRYDRIYEEEGVDYLD